LIQIREITKENFKLILRLKVSPTQERFVASNAISIAEAHFYPENAWYRAIYQAETPVGFLMLDDQPEKSLYFLWRLMIDASHQGKGYGREAIKLLVQYVSTRPNATALYVSYVPGEGGPAPFYEKLGFVPTGEIEEGEMVAKLLL
jgi:diamine N-acetyltransferase